MGFKGFVLSSKWRRALFHFLLAMNRLGVSAGSVHRRALGSAFFSDAPSWGLAFPGGASFKAKEWRLALSGGVRLRPCEELVWCNIQKAPSEEWGEYGGRAEDLGWASGSW